MTETQSVCVSQVVTVRGEFKDVKELEETVVQEALATCRRVYEAACAAYQESWLEAHNDRYRAVRWRRIGMLTPFGLIDLPNRVIREKNRERGGYYSLGKILYGGKATRLLSPMVEKMALEAAPRQNYRPAAETISERCSHRISHWVVWNCVQEYGRRMQEQQQRYWWADKPLGVEPEVVVTEIDSTWLKTQRRGRLAGMPRGFMMHLGLHYTGRERRLQRRGRKDVALKDKTVFWGVGGIGSFGRRLRIQRDRHYGSDGYKKIVLSDGDEGIKWLMKREFDDSTWMLDRWHITQRVREYVCGDQDEFHRIMKPVYGCDSEAVLESIRTSKTELRQERSKEFRELFGYILGNREAIEAYRQIPARFRQSHGRHEAAVKPGSGAVEKNIEVNINRRFKKQGRSWNPLRADRLAQLKHLQQDKKNWNHWWDKVCLSNVRVNPGWAKSDS